MNLKLGSALSNVNPVFSSSSSLGTSAMVFQELASAAFWLPCADIQAQVMGILVSMQSNSLKSEIILNVFFEEALNGIFQHV